MEVEEQDEVAVKQQLALELSESALLPLARAASQGVTNTLSTSVHIRQINRETNKQLATNNLSSALLLIKNTSTQVLHTSTQQTENHRNNKTLDYDLTCSIIYRIKQAHIKSRDHIFSSHYNAMCPN